MEIYCTEVKVSRLVSINTLHWIVRQKSYWVTDNIKGDCKIVQIPENTRPE